MTESFQMYDEWMQQDQFNQFSNLNTPTVLFGLKNVPTSLKDGLKKVLKYVPYSNVVFDNQIPIDFNGWLWIIK